MEGYPGFDTARYPGESLLRAWRGASPYRWIGYYLPAPCHRETSWVGARPTLDRLGWGIAIIYVGQQAFPADTTAPAPTGPVVCSRSLLTADRARADAADAVARALSEGFARGSVIFLDVEYMDDLPPDMAEYYRVWTEEVLRDGRYLPGTYGHRLNAGELYTVARGVFQRAGRTDTPLFGIAGGGGFTLEERPFGSGFPYAIVWQGLLDVNRTWGGATLRIDENVSFRVSPSAPREP